MDIWESWILGRWCQQNKRIYKGNFVTMIWFRLQNIGSITNREEANALKNDLNEPDDSNRKLKSIEALTANQIFGILKIKDPKCDQNGDGFVKGDELKCLNVIWKTFLPHWFILNQIHFILCTIIVQKT